MLNLYLVYNNLGNNGRRNNQEGNSEISTETKPEVLEEEESGAKPRVLRTDRDQQEEC